MKLYLRRKRGRRAKTDGLRTRVYANRRRRLSNRKCDWCGARGRVEACVTGIICAYTMRPSRESGSRDPFGQSSHVEVQARGTYVPAARGIHKDHGSSRHAIQSTLGSVHSSRLRVNGDERTVSKARSVGNRYESEAAEIQRVPRHRNGAAFRGNVHSHRTRDARRERGISGVSRSYLILTSWKVIERCRRRAGLKRKLSQPLVHRSNRGGNQSNVARRCAVASTHRHGHADRRAVSETRLAEIERRIC